MTRACTRFVVAIAVLWTSNAIAQTAEPQPAAQTISPWIEASSSNS